MSPSVLPLTLTILFTLTSLTTSLYLSPSPPAAPFSESTPPEQPPSAAEWLPATATHYTATTSDSVDGACGYGNGYGTATAALSQALFCRGQICGACFELRCVEEESATAFDRRWCVSSSTSVVVTATDFCAPNYGFDAESRGGRCNPPKQHFVLPVEAFEKIAIWKDGNMPVEFRRKQKQDPCAKNNGLLSCKMFQEFRLNLLWHSASLDGLLIKFTLINGCTWPGQPNETIQPNPTKW
ncbi:expansin-A13-like isoform X2 [Lotus japonicus]|uniref:expansin-A13-like isoform X2 n=1 Tax=Lotus japonicus TaxID=34305 RepID=UPI002588CF4D|nr:expansin-A13-like isoform X2 [Lotus japonicus]